MMNALRPLAPLCALSLLLGLSVTLGPATRAGAQEGLTADSKPQPGVPKGEVLRFTFEQSKVFPGTFREYWVYVPAQYTPDRPACVYVNQDGVQWQAPTVFDNLIHKKEMPVTVGVFVVHGRVRAADGEKALDRFNRSLEYDGLGDRYARFILDELLPDVETKKTSDGRPIRLSRNGNDRCIGGASSGAIAAFTAAWERPDAFSRVFSAIGTYVGLRGGDRYSTLIRKVEPKPLRIFLEDGSNDLNIYGGDWWMANQMMERALTFAGYEVAHSWGEGGHNGNHGTVVFPDAMRFLWKGWPEPVKAGKSRNSMLSEILVPGAGWDVVAGRVGDGAGLASGSGGALYVRDEAGIMRMGPSGQPVSIARGVRGVTGIAGAPRGEVIVASEDGRVLSFGEGGKSGTLAKGIRGGELVAASNGNVYITEPETGKVWLVRGNGQKQVVAEGLRTPGGITLSTDQTLLYVAERPTHWVYSYQVQADGTLKHGQQYYWLHVPDSADASDAAAMAVDRDGRLYVATNSGVQVCDQAGRVNCILPIPQWGGARSLTLTGDTLYVSAGDKIYARKLAVKAAPAWDTPSKPAAPRL